MKTEMSPRLIALHAEHELWVRDIRDPAEENTEGSRTVRVDGAEAEYEIAQRPSGTWSMTSYVRYKGGNCHGSSLPWTQFETREDCLQCFLKRARQHFGDELHPADSCVTAQQKEARRKMVAELQDGLFGFVEPTPL